MTAPRAKGRNLGDARPRVVAVLARKGGAGKTTVATLLAAEGVRRGRRVLLVDADHAQGTARTWGEVAAEDGRPAPAVVSMGATLHVPGQLDRVAAGAELVVVDTPPRHDDVVRSALRVADLAVLPVGGGGADVWAVAGTAALLDEARMARPGLRAVLVLTRVRPAAVAHLRDVLGALNVPVAATVLHLRADYERALTAGAGPSTYAPRGVAAEEQRALFDELLTPTRRR